MMLDYGYDERSDRDLTIEPAPVPDATVRVVEADETYGKFVVEPLPRGYGQTLGNPLRRVLLSSIPGMAIDWVRIDGVQHEYTAIPNVKEDVIDILLNVKAVNLRSPAGRSGKLRLDVKGKGAVCAGDIMASSEFEVVNPELHIATLDNEGATLVVEMNVGQGRGYQPAFTQNGLPIGVLPVDAIFTPVRKVNYAVENTRIGQHTDFERLVLEVWTNGAISPSQAVRQGAHILYEHVFRFTSVAESTDQEGGRPSWASSISASLYNRGVESLGLSPRTQNCLKRASIHKVGEVLERSRVELLSTRNFGERSLQELQEKLELLGIRHSDLGDSPRNQAAASGGGAAVAVADEEPGGAGEDEN